MEHQAEIDELMTAVQVVYKVECGYCGESAEESLAAGSASGAAQRFYDLGWRTTESETLCGDCFENES